MRNTYLENHAVYQIYPASFKDSNGDGWGDIQGIISKLDYLRSLGIHILWLSPIYDSPMVDMGYDIKDYYSINPRFGTMADFDQLMEECRKRDIRVVMDLVVNHSSDQCRWFQEALKNPESPYRQYYIFKEGKGRNHRLPPNNWTSTFLGPAWEEVPNEPGMFYLHLFTKQQPDFNWSNEKVIRQVEDIMAFWMDKGVFGFRCDVISVIYKDSFEDGAKQHAHQAVGKEHYLSKEGCHTILKRLRKDVIEPRHGVLIGECLGVTTQSGPAFLDDELDTFFSFELSDINSNRWFKEYIFPAKAKAVIMKWQRAVDFNGNYLENHDQHRSINKFIRPGYGNIGSKMLLTLIYTLRGTPFIYMGQEIGAENYPAGYLELKDCNDCVTQFIFDLAHKTYHLPKALAFAKARHNGRDDSRAPMAFTREPGYGFTDPDVRPWQVFNPLSEALNVQNAEEDKDSPIHYFRQLNALREQSDTLSKGTIEFLECDKTMLAYIREYEGERLLVLLNLNEKPKDVSGFFEKYDLSKVILTNTPQPLTYGLAPYGAFIIRL